MDTNAQVKDRKYRPEIQGVRAIAALLVAIYHIWFARVSGGVDVFFVVSGFLITGSLVRQAEQTGHIAYQKFWAGLVKRLVPAALLVITVTAIASFLLLPKVNWIPVIKQGIAAVVYMENWQQAFSAIDYLADRDAANPFQHFWALSVQGQFYLFWPLLIGVLIVLARVMRWRVQRLIPTTLVLVFAGSLTYSIYATSTNQPFAYFNTFARMWEFAMGGLLVYMLPHIQLSPIGRLVLGWSGLLAIVSCGLLLQVSTAFPGYAALWPTLAASLIIVSGSSDRFGAGFFLSSRFLTWFGDISYSFYLWHWPVLTYYLVLSNTSTAGVMDGIVVLAVSGVLAWLTARTVEEPARFSAIGRERPSRAFAFGVACCLPAVMVLGAWSAYTIELRTEERRQAVDLGQGKYPGALALAEGDFFAAPEQTAEVPIYPGSFALYNSLPRSYDDGCHQDIQGVNASYCVYGDTNGDLTLALVGGSHSAQWLPALEQIAVERGWRILSFTKSACWFSTELKDGDNHDCLEWNNRVIEKLIQLRPNYVFTMATRGQGDGESVPDGYVAQWQVLDRHQIPVLAMRDNPWWRGLFSPAECVDVFGSDSPRCKANRAEVLEEVNPATEAANLLDDVTLLDLTDYFCDEDYCHPVIGNVQVYRDRHHISAAYMETLAPVLEAEIFSEMPELASK